METQIDNSVNKEMAGYMCLGLGYVNRKHSNKRQISSPPKKYTRDTDSPPKDIIQDTKQMAHHSMESTNEIHKPHLPPKGSLPKG